MALFLRRLVAVVSHPVVVFLVRFCGGKLRLAVPFFGTIPGTIPGASGTGAAWISYLLYLFYLLFAIYTVPLYYQLDFKESFQVIDLEQRVGNHHHDLKY